MRLFHSAERAIKRQVSRSGGTGLNLFVDPAAIYDPFRPIQISRDTTSMAGILRGIGH